MGVVKVGVVIENPITNERVSLEAIVDTGASYTVIPWGIDEKLRLPRSGRRVKVKTAKGEDELEEAMAVIELEGVRGFTPVLISKNIDVVLIGLLTLEGFGFEVDPITRKLKKAPIYLL